MTLYSCPICKLPLYQLSNSLKCDNGHNFDFAKEGYINLLKLNNKKSILPGDNKDMISSRRLFLDSGHFDKVILEIIKIIEHYKPNHTKNILDLGCGEGYYTSFFQKEFNEIKFYGLDISKYAIKLAAKKHKKPVFFVASSKDIPLQEKSIDAIIKICAPMFVDEISKILKEEHIIVSVSPGNNHLIEIRNLLYKSIRNNTEKLNKIVDVDLIHTKEVKLDMSLNRKELQNLINMTPFKWKMNNKLEKLVMSNSLFNCTAHFKIEVLKLKPSF